MLSDISRDVRFAFRALRRRPRAAAVALLTLTLGIGAPTAIFSVVHAVLLRPLPYPDPERIVRFHLAVKAPSGPGVIDGLPVAEGLQWAADSRTLDALAIFQERALTLTTGEGPYRMIGIAATANLFEVLGTAPLIGRTFGDASDTREIVLGHGAWRRFFGSRPDVVGTIARFDGEPYRVVGVMPAEFGFPARDAAFWIPVTLTIGGTRGMMLPVVARLQPDTTVAAAVEEGSQFLQDRHGPDGPPALRGVTLHEELVGSVSRVLWILLGAVGVVSLVATANITLLLLVRGAVRARELSVRLAVGASRARLVRQLLVETATLGAIGGIAALLFAALMLRAFVALAPADMPRLQGAALNLPVLGFAAALTVGTSLLVGVLSAGRSVALDPLRSLGAGAEGPLATAGPSRRRLNTLAAGELAMTMVLLVGAALLLRSFGRLVLVDPGFDPGTALAFQVTLPSSRYPTAEARLAFHERLLDRLRASGEIGMAGLITTMPNRQPSGRFDFNPRGTPPGPPDPATMQVAEVRNATDGFLEAMGLRLLAGRTLRAEDAAGSEAVMVISESLARLHFPDGDAVGRMLYSRSGEWRVIGVVGDVRPAAPRPMVAPAAYLSLRQDPEMLRWFATVTVVVRGGRPTSLARSIRSQILSLDPEMPPFNVRTLEDEVSGLVAGPRFSAAALTVFGVLALIMAAVGVYGVVAYSAEARTREIGVRMALGATRRQVMAVLLREGLQTIAMGLTAGILAASWLTRSLTGLLHEVQPADPLAYGGVVALLATAAVLAVYVPARRATGIDAVEALRAE